MQTRRDHVQAYQFAMARLGSALVCGDASRDTSPNRRPLLGTFFGILIIVLLCVGFWVYGLLVPGGNTSWRKPGSIIVEKETGNRYLYIDGELRPTRNYASAMLLAGNNPQVQSVSRNSLKGVRHGAPVGIPDAPDSLATPKELIFGPWARCLRSDVRSGQVVDFDPADSTRDFPEDRLILLSSADDEVYLLWKGIKYPVPNDSALIALGFDALKPVPAPDNWLSVLKTGPKLAAARIPGAGEPGRKVAGQPSKIGQLFWTTIANTDHYYLMRSDGVESVTPTQAALLTGRAGAEPARSVRPADIAAVPVSRKDPLAPVPAVLGVSPLHLDDEVLCLRQTARGTDLRTRVALGRGPAVSRDERVLVPPGRGVFVVDQTQLAEASSPQLFLITDQGLLHVLESTQSASQLGYGSVTPQPLPEDLIKLLPRGPRLGQGAATATLVGR